MPGNKVVYGRLVSESGTIHTPGSRMRVTAVHKSMESDRMRLVITKGDLDEFRCGSCHALLFKGLNLEKSMIEVKCRSCGTLLVSESLLVLQ